MSKPWKTAMWLFGSMITLFFLWALWMYEGIAAQPRELHNQLAQIIRDHDTARMKEISLDKPTEQFLLGLPKDASIQASDFQGGGNVRSGVEIGSFSAAIGTRPVDCFMVLHTHPLSFLPHWQLVKVSIFPTGIDPSWAG